VIGFDSAIQAGCGPFFCRSDCPNHAAEQNWLELNRLFPKSRMNITMVIQMDSFRMDTQADSDTGHPSPDAHDCDGISVKGR
jgi:hypothetical protein